MMSRDILIIAVVGVALATGCTTTHPNDSSNSALNLSFHEFDQTPHSGWRAVGEDLQRYQEAAALIKMYLRRHTDLDAGQGAILHFHAGQMLAFAGDNAAAVGQLSSARLDSDLQGLQWNDYVDATIAYLQQNRASLQTTRERMAANSPNDPNLPVVDSLIAHFGASYLEAYTARNPSKR